MKIVVVGGGISGCVCAWRLSKAGHRVTLLEKGRGVGGRMATRRMEGARIDHGAQFFTVRDQRMRKLLELWTSENAVLPWYDMIRGREDLPRGWRHRGREGMTSPAKVLAKEFTVKANFFVERAESECNQWRISEREGEGRSLEAEHLVLTIPSVQMLDLFNRSGIDLEPTCMQRLRAIRHSKCLALLGLLEGASKLPEPGTFTHPTEEIDWISENQLKGISEKPAFTLHASSGYSEKFWDYPDQEWAPPLLSKAEEILGVSITSWVSHRWGYAKPLVTFGATHWHSQERNLTLAGDGFGGERIENAALSGWEAADSILGSSGS